MFQGGKKNESNNSKKKRKRDRKGTKKSIVGYVIYILSLGYERPLQMSFSQSERPKRLPTVYIYFETTSE
jgi:hypothetical protein